MTGGVAGKIAAGMEQQMQLRAELISHGARIADIDDFEANTGLFADIVFQIANLLLAHGEHLRAGDIISSGSLTGPVFSGHGDSFSYQLKLIEPLNLSLQG